MSKTILQCKQVSKTYEEGRLKTPVLHDINLSVEAGETVAIVGKSGSGKSTLLHLLGGLDDVTLGEVTIMGNKLSRLTVNDRGLLRNRYLGFVYQFHHLLPEFTALENVMMPLLIRGDSQKTAKVQASELLHQVELGTRLRHKPTELSGGERQRAAIARALVTHPACVLADEPTGNLDNQTASAVFDIMQSMHEQLNTSFIIVTHDQQLAKRMGRTLQLEDGHLV